MSDRKSTNWINDYLLMTENQNSPKLFHLWVAIATLAATIERNVYLDYDFFKLFPNLLTTLVAPPATCTKTTAMNIGKTMVRELHNPPMAMTQKLTPQFLIKKLGKDEQEDDGTDSSMVCFSREFSVLIGQDAFNNGLTDIIGDLYDCPDGEPYYGTIARGETYWRRGCVNILGCTTPTHIKRVIPRAELGGGFVSRVLFIRQDKGRGIARPFLTSAQRKIREHLIDDLQIIRALKFAYKLSAESNTWYDEYYHEHETKGGINSEYTARRPQHVLKIGMLIAASLSSDMVISLDHIQFALKLLKEIEKYMIPVIQGIEMTESGEHTERVRNIIWARSEGILYGELSKLTYRFARRSVLREILQTLLDSNEIIQRKVGRGIAYFPVFELESEEVQDGDTLS